MPEFLSAEGLPGVSGIVRTMQVWDPDGPGPQAPRIVAGGSFDAAGAIRAQGVVTWDGVSWSPLGAGIEIYNNSGPGALAATPSGELFASNNRGTFAEVLRWNGSTWAAVGAGSFNGYVYALAVTPSGDLLAGGTFTSVGTVQASGIARWNGTAWSSLGSGANPVYAIAVSSHGDVFAGGQFSTAGGTSAPLIARWNGTSWAALGVGLSGFGNPIFTSSSVRSILVQPNGDLIVGGVFSSAGAPVRNVARWDGSAWSAVGTAYPGGISASYVSSLSLASNGNVVAGGGLRTSSDFGFVSQWNGAEWTDLTTALQIPYISTNEINSVRSVAQTPNGDIFAGGSFTNIGTRSLSFITRWDGSSWVPLAPGFTGPLYTGSNLNTSTVLPSGNLVVGGSLSGEGSTAFSNIAQQTTAGWTPLSQGLNSTVSKLISTPDGDLVAAGQFTLAGPTPVARIARWNGVTWSPLGLGISSIGSLASVPALAALQNGAIVAAGSFTTAGNTVVSNIARWDGADWNTLGDGLSDSAASLLVLPSGDLVAGGKFTFAGGTHVNRIARWDGSEWWPFGSGMTGGGTITTVSSLILTPGGDLVAGGEFAFAGGSPASNIARWNGQSWSPLGTGLPGTNASVSCLGVLHNGQLIAGGTFSTAGGPVLNNVSRWDGTSWAPLTSGLVGRPNSISVLPSGEIVIVGTGLGSAIGIGSFAYLARFACPSCYANCDSSTATPILNVNDFQCFLNRFASSDTYANCDGSSIPPVLNVNDFQCFLNMFAAGCP